MVVGWAIYIGIGLFALSGLIHIWDSARRGGSVTQMGLCQWCLAIAVLIVFGMTDWNKLHLLWLVPVGYVGSFTGFGRAVGTIVGVITATVFGANRT